MSSQGTKPSWTARLSLAALTLLLTACQENFARRDTIAFHAGEAAAYNKAVHIIDPWPAASARTDIDYNGKRVVGAIERYETRQDGASAAPAPMMMAPMPMPGPGAAH